VESDEDKAGDYRQKKRRMDAAQFFFYLRETDLCTFAQLSAFDL
jgi:hypothetical protein